jgi:preprotein translocase subunit YajC
MLKNLIYLFPILAAASLSAQEEGAPPPQSMWQTVIMIVIAIAFFYLLLWRPEQKRRKALEEQRSGLQQGDRVVAMGIIGTVLRVQEETVILKMYDGAKLEVLKGAITDVTSGSEAETAKSEKETVVETNG